MPRQRIGIDVVPLERVQKSLEGSPERYMDRFLTRSESEYCQGPRLVERLAGRIAAKEAVMKLLGDGWPRVAWTDIEILSSGGRPRVTLSGKALALAKSRGMEDGSLDVSITHDGGIAVAAAVALFAEDLRAEG